jgi:hypothetical protein
MASAEITEKQDGILTGVKIRIGPRMKQSYKIQILFPETMNMVEKMWWAM